jgi:hypothetical protein
VAKNSSTGIAKAKPDSLDSASAKIAPTLSASMETLARRDNPQILGAALRVLFRLDSARAVLAVAQLLKSPELPTSVRSVCMETLVDLSNLAQPVLLALLRSKLESVRERSGLWLDLLLVIDSSAGWISELRDADAVLWQKLSFVSEEDVEKLEWLLLRLTPWPKLRLNTPEEVG